MNSGTAIKHLVKTKRKTPGDMLDLYRLVELHEALQLDGRRKQDYIV